MCVSEEGVLKKVCAKLNKRSVRDTQRQQQDAAECHSYRSGHVDRPGINTHTTNTQHTYTHTHTFPPCKHRNALRAKEIFVCKLRMIAQVFLQSDWQTRLHLEWLPLPLLAHSFSTRSQFIITTATTGARKSSMNAVGQDNQMSASISAFRQLSSLLCPPGATVNWKLKTERWKQNVENRKA